MSWNTTPTLYRTSTSAAIADLVAILGDHLLANVGQTLAVTLNPPGAVQLPVLGPFVIDGVTFYIRKVAWAVGFNIDNDAEPDVWITLEQLMNSDIAPKAAIRQKLIDEGWVEE